MLLARTLFYSVLFNIFEEVRQNYSLKFSGCSVHPPEAGPFFCGQERALFYRVTRPRPRCDLGLLARPGCAGQPCQGAARPGAGLAAQHGTCTGGAIRAGAAFSATRTPISARP